MNPYRKLNGRQIVMNTGMSTRPEYYSGRGAIFDDLNDHILEGIYTGVEREHGMDAAQNFAQMVADIPKLTATDFLLAFYRLESNEWKWDRSRLGSEHGLYPADLGTAQATVVEALRGSRERDETASIRREFLRRHSIEPPASDRTRSRHFSPYDW